MDYSVLAETYEKLEKVPSKISKAEILADLFKKAPTEELPKVVLMIMGRVFPTNSEYELGIANQMMLKTIAKASGFSVSEVEQKFKKTGDLGLAAEECAKGRKQSTLLKKKLSVDYVFGSLRKLPFATGQGSQEKKLNIIAELLLSSQPKEARYIVRTAIENLRVGAAEGIIRDAIVNAFLLKGETSKERKKEITGAVDYAWNIISDFGEIARIAKEKGIEGLKRPRLEIGKPIQVMLAEKAGSMEEVFKEFKELFIETKYDGMRAQIHKKGNEVWVYTRRLENLTKQFPDLVEFCKKGLTAKECIVEGEVLGISSKTKLPLPFQVLSQRIHRKYGIEQMKKEIPIQINLFDVIYVDGKLLVDMPFIERRKILEKIIRPIPGKLQAAEQLFTSDIRKAEKFYKKALDAKQEGAMLKVPTSTYVFGRHVGGWYKIKPIMETLDLVIIGATWGEGKRSKWLSSYVLACREPDSGKFLECGMMSTGLTEEEYENMTKVLKPLVLIEKGKNVEIKPKVVVETGYQEIQKSPNYTSGFALRFPRLVRIRQDRSAEDADTIDRVVELFKSQGRRG
jgi:DNA ligase-1